MNSCALKKILILCSFLIILISPQYVFAHAMLEKAIPAPDSHLKASPTEIVLMFNERLEKELYSIKVFNRDGDMVSTNRTEMSKEQKLIKQILPSLSNGIYTISYSVLSADGHPVNGSYVISVGESAALANDMSQLNLHQHNDKSILLGSIHSVVRILYFMALLFTAGWIVWGTFFKIDEAGIRTGYKKWSIYLQMMLLISIISLGLLQFAELLGSWSVEGIWSILTGTSIGISWLFSLLLSAFGFAILLHFKWLDRLWVFLLLAAKSINGHAMAFDPPIRTVSLDFIHLLAASLWAGGLLFLLVYWKKQKEQASEFLLLFSKVAIISIFVLIVTGVASTLIFIPKVSYLFYTQWGILLLVKVALVLIVIAIGSILRYTMKQVKKDAIGKLLKIDFALMLVIVGIVGIFTHLNPLPENKPLEWHVQENGMEFTATITPKVPGDNHFMVVAKSHKEGVNIKNIELHLQYKDNPDVAPIEVPFSDLEQSKNVNYMINGKYLPFAGKWTAEIRILDSEDNEKVYKKDFIVY